MLHLGAATKFIIWKKQLSFSPFNLLGPLSRPKYYILLYEGLISNYEDIILPLLYRNIKQISSYVDLIFVRNKSGKKK